MKVETIDADEQGTFFQNQGTFLAKSGHFSYIFIKKQGRPPLYPH